MKQSLSIKISCFNIRTKIYNSEVAFISTLLFSIAHIYCEPGQHISGVVEICLFGKLFNTVTFPVNCIVDIPVFACLYLHSLSCLSFNITTKSHLCQTQIFKSGLHQSKPSVSSPNQPFRTRHICIKPGLFVMESSRCL